MRLFRRRKAGRTDPDKKTPARQTGVTLAEIETGHKERYRFAAGHAQRGDRVLDAACGVGYGSAMLSDAGCHVTGVDISPDAIASAMRNYRADVWINAAIADLGLAPGRFDMVVTLETLEHLVEPEAALRRFAALLKDDGLLVASVPNELFYPYDPAIFGNDDFPHQRHYTPPEFEALLRQGGFSHIEMFRQEQRADPVTPGDEGVFILALARVTAPSGR